MNAVLLRLIEKQAALRGIHARLEATQDAPGRFVKDGIGYGPCLLISRECAAGGGKIARLIGQRLGWDVFDGELVDEVARVAHERQRLIASVDERFVSIWEHTWQDVLLRTGAVDQIYLHYLRQVILTIAHNGHAVIVGRGAQHLLPPQCALRVRLVAPIEFRAQNAATIDQIAIKDALAKIKTTDAARESFIWKTYHTRADSPLTYDLVLNTGDMGIVAATEIVLAALAAKLGVHPSADHHATPSGATTARELRAA